ncbi:MAG: TIGR00282 family metallophosphoesterase [Candidatus Zapsychrus exili]|nr:TIGR00282 family metallophosphoesterase [Candidatus Zapsychrus exili]
MNILCIGDIVGKPGRLAVEKLLDGIKQEFNIDFVIANAENVAGGAGLTPRIARHLLSLGCDCLTLGDHVWDQKEVEDHLDETDTVIRPANFPEGVPGKGFCIKETSKGIKVGIINLLGRVFIRYNSECPFKALERIVSEIKKETSNIIVDFHAEATSEKVAMGHFSDGRISAIFGTHTHVQTADETVLSGGTAYITDVGMTGPHDSVIGQQKENIIKRFLTSMPVRFSVARDDIRLNGVVVDIDETTGFARSIVRIQRKTGNMTNEESVEEK